VALYILIKEPAVIELFQKMNPHASEHMGVEEYRGWHVHGLRLPGNPRVLKHIKIFQCPSCDLLYECLTEVLDFDTLELECYCCDYTTTNFYEFLIPLRESWKYVKNRDDKDDESVLPSSD